MDEKNVFDAIKEMSTKDLGRFISKIYHKGETDAMNNVSDEAVFCERMLFYPESFIEEDWG